MEARLLLGGVNREFQPQILHSADRMCDILRAEPNSTGKRQALDYLNERGYGEGWQHGYTFGVMVDVQCPEVVPVTSTTSPTPTGPVSTIGKDGVYMVGSPAHGGRTAARAATGNERKT